MKKKYIFFNRKKDRIFYFCDFVCLKQQTPSENLDFSEGGFMTAPALEPRKIPITYF